MENIGKIMILIGGILVFSGLLIFCLGKFIPGHLPGDIFIKKGNFSFYFPIVSCLIASLVLSLVINIFRRF
ncbi:MAG: DUF2905 domain-containing protein [Clostridiales bacterium]